MPSPARPLHLKKSNEFPKLTKQTNDVTSDIDYAYNCIAFAYGVTDKFMWPTFHPDHFWPTGVPRALDMPAFIRLFESIGYTVCPTIDLTFTPGVSKVALYSKNGTPTHAARQVGQNRWASKLGRSYDIEHTDSAVTEGLYGKIDVVMQR